MPPTTPAPPRLPLPDRLRLHAGYHWRNSADPRLTRTRTAWDTRDGAVFPAVRSDLAGLSVCYAGLAEGLAYTLEFTELRREAGHDSARRDTTRLSGRHLRDPATLPDADIAIIGTSATRARALPRAASLIVPMRVHFVVDTHTGPDATRARISKRERQQYAATRRTHHWAWQPVHDPCWFDEFYDRMYRPTMRARHGDRERTETKDAAYECLFRTGRLFALTQDDGQRIGGALCHWDRASATLTLRLLGIQDGDSKHYDSGAFKAIYHLLIDWAARNGVRHLDFQGTEPFLSKGTYQWKRRFGSRVVLPPNHFGEKRLWLRVNHDTPQVRDFLVANPLLAEDPHGHLEAVYFHDHQRPARLDYSAASPGVHHTRHLDLDTFLAPLTTPRHRAAR
ncbi:hypothetical protein [Streptomyces sp. Y1]|uniref:BioF2-like acetyltransferase domain-containing protein n=1 Tax=Streptomyces sp. Y1 TaxID=3238634 RepID=A0AB39T8R3_9ACTN